MIISTSASWSPNSFTAQALAMLKTMLVTVNCTLILSPADSRKTLTAQVESQPCCFSWATTLTPSY